MAKEKINPRPPEKETFRLVVEAAPNGMVMVDSAGIIVLVNSQGENLFGYSRAELIGQPVEILVPERLRSKHPMFRSQFARDPQARPMGVGRDLYGLRKDGKEVPVEIGLNPIRTEEGEFVLASIVDITERKRSEERFRLVFEAAPSGMIMVDKHGKIVLLNSQAEELFGYSREELIGQSIELLVPESARGKHPDYRDAFFADLKARAMGGGRDLYGLNKNGKQIPVEIGLNPLVTGGESYVIASIVDISKRKAAEQELRQSEERFRQLMSGVKDYAIILLDVDGCVMSWNEGAQRIKGYYADEIIGRHFSCFYRTEDIEAGKPERELEAARRFERFEDEGWRVRKDGSRFVANVVISTLRDDSGELQGYVKVTRDITERKQAEERLRLVVEAAPSGMIMVDDKGKIVLVNSQAEHLFGYDREELLGHPIEMLVPVRFRDKHPGYRQSFSADPQTRAMGAGRDLFGVRKDGTEVPVEIGLNPLDTEEGAFVLASVVDITERKRSEELGRARDKALQDSQLKSAFVANISHELRTPVSGIMGMNELLLETNLDEQQRMLAKSVSDAAQSLLSIINDLLDISKIEAGKTTLRKIPFGLISLVQDSVRMLADNARSKRLALNTNIDYSIPDYLVGDPDRIRQVLINLLGNAIKFTEKGVVSIEAKLEGEDEKEALIRFSVRDTGIGIAGENLNLLFQPFSQLDSSSRRRFGGTGLGLSISRQLVELMGGEIGVESQTGEGSTFSFRIPLQKLKHDAVPEKSGGETTAASVDIDRDKLVLIVEDNATLQELAVRQLIGIGLEPQAVSTGLQAVNAAKEVPYDLILMDCNLPEMDGFEATRAIRRIDAERGRHTYIIAMTASGMSGDADKCYAAGMDDYLMKPVTMAKLKEHIQKWIQLLKLHET